MNMNFEIIGTFLKLLYRGFAYVLKYPERLIQGWTAIWITLLYGMYLSQGVMGVVQFAMTSMFNMSSMFGIMVPVLMMTIIFLESLTKLIKNWVVGWAVMLFKTVQREIMQTGKKIKKAAKKVEDAFKKIKLLKANAYLGSDFDPSEHEEELLSSFTELMYALELEGLAE
jgi:hypothetical protein